MITRLSSLMGLIVAIAAGPSFAQVDPDSPSGNELPKDQSAVASSIPKIDNHIVFQIAAEMPQVPAQLPYHKTKTIEPTQAGGRAGTLRQAFDFTGELVGVETDDRGPKSAMHMDASKNSLEVFRSGAVFYSEEELISEHGDDLFELLGMSPAQAEDEFAGRAELFLAQIDLERKGLQQKGVSFAHLAQSNGPEQEEVVKTLGAAVHYGLEIDGIPAWGPGAKTTVYFGQKGISGYYDAMRDFEPEATIELRSPGRVVSDYIEVDRPQTLLRSHSGVVEQAVIEEVALVYFMDAGNKDQDYISPHYLIEGTFYGWNPGPDPQAPREGSTTAEPVPFTWLEPAHDTIIPVPEPDLALQLGVGIAGLIAALMGRRTARSD
jgi:hypothetical protein